MIDLEKFVQRGDIDPVYFDSPYYLYPDGPIAVETLRVIGAAMAEAGVAGLGRLTLSRRERMVMVEPRGERDGAVHVARRERGSGIAIQQRKSTENAGGEQVEITPEMIEAACVNSRISIRARIRPRGAKR